MNKRTISFVLCLCLVFSLVTGLGVSAYADDTVTHTIVAGDSLWDICSKQGLDYYACKDAIMILNGFTSDYQLSHLTIGDKVILPASNEAAKNVKASEKKTDTTTGTGNETGTGNASGNASGASAATVNTGDVVSYYLVGYQMAAGETVGAIYNTWGMDYSVYTKEILGVNGLQGFNYMYAGRTYLFPVSSVPTGTTASYTVIAHKVAAGEVAYDLCNGYGVNYNNVLSIIKGLNNGSALTGIYAGQMIYIPVPGTASANGSGSGSSSGSGSTVPSDGVSYPINCLSASNGGFVAKVGSSAVSNAVSGSTVSIVATPNSGYAVNSIKVTKAGDDSTVVSTNSSSFVMPKYAVNISVEFKLSGSTVSNVQHKIVIEAAENGKVSALVNGSAVNTSAAGTFVTISAKANDGYEIDSIKAYTSADSKELTLTSNAFNMPDKDVKIVVTFKALATYNINSSCGKNGTLSFKVNGKAATTAMAGQTVTIVTTPADGYALDSFSVRFADGTAITKVENQTFVMPSKDVTVTVSFAKSFKINTAANNGTVGYKVNGVSASKAVPGDKVSVSVSAPNGYTVSNVKVYEGTKVEDIKETSVAYKSFSGETGSFTMPEYDVIVKATYKKVATYSITASDTANCESVKFLVNGTPVKAAAEGSKVTVVVTPDETHSISSITSSDVTINASNYTFTMPASDVAVDISLTELTEQNIIVKYNPKRGTPTLIVDSKTLKDSTASDTDADGLYEAVFSVLPGKKVQVVVNCSAGYAVNSMKASYSGGKITIDSTDSFTMVNDEATVKVTFRGLYLTLNAEDSTNGTYTLIDSNGKGVSGTVAAGSTVYVKPVANEYYELDKVTISYLDGDKTVTKNITSGLKFQMPGSDATLKVTFKATTRQIVSATMTAPAESNATLKVFVNNKHQVISSAVDVPVFETVAIEPVLPKAGYSVKDITIKDAATGIVLNKFIKYDKSAMTFEMPTDFDVEIIVTVVAD